MVSVEAQHAGCRVVASKSGGLPETNIGGLVLVKPDDPKALAVGIARALALGPMSAAERHRAASKFTITKSVDQLLSVIKFVPSEAKVRKGHPREAIIQSPGLRQRLNDFGAHWT